MENHEKDGEISLHDAVENLDLDEVHQRVLKNAADTGYSVTDEHLDVIDTLIGHYQQACATEDCLEPHHHMRFLEKSFSDRGGSGYLYKLFHDEDGPDGVLHAIHKLAELPGLRLDVDKGFGTAF